MGGLVGEHTMVVLVAVGFLLALIAPFLVRALGTKALAAVGLVPLLFAGLFALAPEGSWSVPWVPTLGIELAFRMDGLSRVFAVLISGLGGLILLYASAYFEDDTPRLGRWAASFLAFMAAMLGLVLADDLIALFVFWEITSITSFLLIGFHHASKESRTSAQQALLVTGAGGLAMLAGLVVLAGEQGTMRLSELGPSQNVLAFILILAGCVTKSAQFPFHFWLPNAMAAPTPVSAFLHSATMVKAGVFLLARLRPTFEGLPAWSPALIAFGTLTVLAAGTLIFWHRDIKKLLAYSTVGSLGFLVFLLGLPGKEALKAFVAFLVAHALFKGALFMVAGILDHATHTRDTFVLRGLGKQMPITFAAAVVSALSGLGLVGLLGFQGKEYAILATQGNLGLLVVAAYAIPAGCVAMRLITPFGGPDRDPEAHEAPPAMLAGPVILAVAGVVGGLGVANLGPHVLNPMAAAISGTSFRADWIAFPDPGGAFMIGLGLVLAGMRLGGLHFRTASWLPPVTLDALARAVVDGFPKAAAIPTRWVQTGRVRGYFELFFFVITAVALIPLIVFGPMKFPAEEALPRVHEVALVALALIATTATLLAKSRLAAITMLGIVGTAIAVTFLTFGAPDLSITQLLTELLTIVIAALVFGRLPGFRKFTEGRLRVRQAILATTFGVTMGLLVLAVNALPPSQEVSRQITEWSVPKAYGRNVVNTILVDFRAMDTLGEATVLTVAALGVFALMRLRITKEAE